MKLIKNIEEHHKEFKKNRKILSIIIDSVLLCGRPDLSLREHVEAANPGVFRSLLEFAASLDEDMLQRAVKMHSKPYMMRYYLVVCGYINV